MCSNSVILRTLITYNSVNYPSHYKRKKARAGEEKPTPEYPGFNCIQGCGISSSVDNKWVIYGI
ncbi:hypothetical protein SDJN02_03347, partial [Cucurbita argyrosperma subsp. argyrosperma]